MTDTTQMFFDKAAEIPLLKSLQKELMSEALLREVMGFLSSARNSDFGKNLQTSINNVKRALGENSDVFVEFDDVLNEFCAELCESSLIRGIYLSCRLLDDHLFWEKRRLARPASPKKTTHKKGFSSMSPIIAHSSSGGVDLE